MKEIRMEQVRGKKDEKKSVTHKAFALMYMPEEKSRSDFNPLEKNL